LSIHRKKCRSRVEAVAREREEVARLAKVLYARKSELEGILKTALKDRDELVLGGIRYAMFKASKADFPLGRTLEVLAKATGLTQAELLGRIATVNRKELEKLLKDQSKTLGRSQATLLKAELEAISTKTYSPRFWAKKAVAA
jgi:hypothetical protein